MRRILFAEFMGWSKLGYINDELWGYEKETDDTIRRAPDCENNDTDCMALKLAIIDRGWHWEEYWQPSGDCSSGGIYFHIWDAVTEQHERTDRDLNMWRHGVCDLAEPIVREAMNETTT